MRCERSDGGRAYVVPEGNLAGLREAFGKLANRAAKLGVTPPRLRVLATRIVAAEEPDPMWAAAGHPERTRRRHRTVHDVAVEGEAPRLKGYRLVGTIDHASSAGAGNVVRSVAADDPVPARFRSAPPRCDHCAVKRRRNETFVLRAEAGGDLRQIGRSCLGDFFGTDDPDLIAAAFEQGFLARRIAGAAEDEGWERGTGRIRHEPLDLFLATVHRTIRRCGWLGAAAARESLGRATWKEVADTLAGRPNRRPEEPVTPWPDDADRQAATAAAAWLVAQPDGGASEYLLNLKAATADGCVARANFGLVCSLIPTWRRALERDAEARATANSGHVGAAGERGGVKVTVLGISRHQSAWGALSVVRMADDKGNLLVWRTRSADGLETGKAYEIRGTVKRHGERQCRKETSLSRVHVVRALGRAEECGQAAEATAPSP